MDPTRGVWQTDEVRAAVAAGTAGAVVRAVRHANHLTLEQLAQRCGYSVSTLSRMERGKQPLTDVRVLRHLADALRIPPQLLGLVDTPAPSVQGPRPTARVTVILSPDEESDPMRRRTLLAGLSGLAGVSVVGAASPAAANARCPIEALEAVLLDPADAHGVPLTLSQLRNEVAQAQAGLQLGRYTEVAAGLPGLLSAAQATRAECVSTEDTAAAQGQLAELYTLASELMVKSSRDPAAWITADRAVQAARESGDVLTEAAARRAWAIVLRRAGHTGTAQRQVVDTAAALQADLHRGPEFVSLYGSLLSTAAYTAASDGDRATAHTLISEAIDAARRLGADANHRFTAFGPSAVGVYRINIARVLGDYGTAIDAARCFNPAMIPLPEQRARYWSNIARSFHAWGKPEDTLRALLAAERAAPDEVRYRKPIQQITTSLLRHPTATRLPGLRAFAGRAGVST